VNGDVSGHTLRAFCASSTGVRSTSEGLRSNAAPDCLLLHHLNAKVLLDDFDGR